MENGLLACSFFLQKWRMRTIIWVAILQNTPRQFDCIFVQGLTKGNIFIQPLQEGKNPF